MQDGRPSAEQRAGAKDSFPCYDIANPWRQIVFPEQRAGDTYDACCGREQRETTKRAQAGQPRHKDRKRKQQRIERNKDKTLYEVLEGVYVHSSTYQFLGKRIGLLLKPSQEQKDTQAAQQPERYSDHKKTASPAEQPKCRGHDHQRAQPSDLPYRSAKDVKKGGNAEPQEGATVTASGEGTLTSRRCRQKCTGRREYRS